MTKEPGTFKTMISGFFEAIGRIFATLLRGFQAFFGGIIGFVSHSAPVEALVEFFQRNKIVLYTAIILILIVGVYLLPSALVTVKAGEAAVEWSRFSGGTIPERVYGEGTHIVNPLNKIFYYNVRTQEVKHEMDALTSNGLVVHVSLSIRYRPEYNFLAVLHQRIGPDYVNTIVIPEVESEIRRVIGKFTPEELFTSQGGVLEGMMKGSFAEVGENFIQLDDVIVRSLKLPDSIQKAIESKLTQQQQMLEYEYRLMREHKEAERKEIEARGVSDYNRIINLTLTDRMLTWEGIAATRELATSTNAKIIVVGNSRNGLPIVFSPD
jgi:prohibitin 1